MDISQYQSQESNDVSVYSDPEVYPIYLKSMGSTRSEVLYDVDGNQLRDANGDFINIWRGSMADMFTAGTLRLIHNISPGYRYFITKKSQMENFLFNRKYGAEKPNLTYCIYEDEDIDKTPRKNHKVVYLSSVRKKLPKKNIIVISP